MESEAQTRKQRIDTKLRDAGWQVVPYNDGMNLSLLAHHALEEYPTANGPADYALVSEGQLVGVVEAKKVTVGPKGVLVQAERYSQGVKDSPFNFAGYRVPLLYSTNGEVIYFHDVRHSQNTSRKLSQFHTPEALQEMLGLSFADACEWFTSNPNAHPKLRSYQRDANTAVEGAIAKGKRQMLVAMATGTGKTFTTVNQAYRLLKSGGARRILFLVDRRALAAQAVRAFASFEPEPNLKFDKIYEVYSNRFQKEDFGEEDKFDAKVMPNDYLTDPQPKHVFVYVCTIQRMAVSILGRSAVFDGDGDGIDSDAVKPIRMFLNPDYLVAFLNSHYGIQQAHGGILGSGIQNLNVENVRKYRIPVPPLSEQKEIVRRVEKLFAFADQIEARLRQAQAHVDRLTQSLLAKAFRGELVPTEAELARRQKRPYEAASTLLTRIQAIHEVMEKMPKRKCKRQVPSN